MLIYDILSMDHRMVMDSLDAIERVPEPDRRKDMLSFIRTELVMHAKAEEDAFYTPLKDWLTQEGLDSHLLETSEDDHQAVEKLLLTLTGGSGGDEGWLDTLRELRAALQRHINKEENDVFRLARERFSTLEAAEIGANFIAFKGRYGMENPIALALHKVKEMVS